MVYRFVWTEVLAIEVFSLYDTVTQKSDAIWCWRRQQSDVNETASSGNTDCHLV